MLSLNWMVCMKSGLLFHGIPRKHDTFALAMPFSSLNYKRRAWVWPYMVGAYTSSSCPKYQNHAPFWRRWLGHSLTTSNLVPSTCFKGARLLSSQCTMQALLPIHTTSIEALVGNEIQLGRYSLNKQSTLFIPAIQQLLQVIEHTEGQVWKWSALLLPVHLVQSCMKN